MLYPETEKLRNAFLDHKKKSGLSFVRYSQAMGVSRRSLQQIAVNKVRPLYEIGKRVESWLQQNPNQNP